MRTTKSDSERVNWIQENKDAQIFCYHNGIWVVSIGDKNHSNLNLREAIDAAMQSEGE